jgi:hypothetical protein
VTEPL